MTSRCRWRIGCVLATALLATTATSASAQSERRPGGIENVPTQKDSLESAPGTARGVRRPTTSTPPPAAAPAAPAAPATPPQPAPKAAPGAGKSSEGSVPRSPTVGAPAPPPAAAPAAAAPQAPATRGMKGGSERRPGGIERAPDKE